MNLECSGPRFLTFFVQGLSYNILADFIFLGEIEKFSSSSSFGPQAMRHSSIRESKTILSPFFFNNDLIENTQVSINHATPSDLHFLSPVLLRL